MCETLDNETYTADAARPSKRAPQFALTEVLDIEKVFEQHSRTGVRLSHGLQGSEDER
jgi:hypothetical protein